ncbi:MAG: hypothetical protein IJC57_00865 [Clostridia bacterium]|nr:hypothetical protein [Clostridia bacterium]
MKKLARKLSVFALSSVILLSNPPIKAGMFAEGQTYDLGEVGTVKIENYHSLGNSEESFDILGFHCEIIIYQNGYAVDFTNNITGSTFYCRWENEPGQLTASTLILKDISDEILRRTTNPFVKEIPKSTKQRKEKQDKFVEEKKPKKVNPTKHRKITYNLPKGQQYDYQHGHCACKQPDPSSRTKEFEAKIGEQNVCFVFYPCLKCKRPIRQSRENNKNCCWRTYCNECHQETEFYMKRGMGDKCILICCSEYPFELHEIEYASIAEFNDAVDRGRIKYICSKNPDHTRAHVYKGERCGAVCLDCMAESNATRIVKK